eukprot:3748623-Rhodomonas_salina.2
MVLRKAASRVRTEYGAMSLRLWCYESERMVLRSREYGPTRQRVWCYESESMVLRVREYGATSQRVWSYESESMTLRSWLRTTQRFQCYAMRLRGWCAVRGTEIAYALPGCRYRAPHSGSVAAYTIGTAHRSGIAPSRVVQTLDLVAPYAVSVPHIAQRFRRTLGVLRGTELAHGAIRCAVLG